MAAGSDTPHLPRPALIEAYGNAGFRFGGGLSHRGSILCFPDGIWAWPVADASEINKASLAAAFAHGGGLDFFLIGSGSDPWPLPQPLRDHFHTLHISVDVMTTGAAVRTWNILLAEGRRVGAGLIAVE